ncbi:MAG: hypothetical protein WCL10_18820 [Novosphingobium sp.]|uniref:hypothetical protein n=1 Tax=Novosphingobium sp. TaxID=1874826 RepID=UPI00301923E5
MPDDLVTRLLNIDHDWHEAACHEAAAEIRSLREQVARARIEGAEIMREAAADAFEIPDGEQWDDCCIDTLYDYECAIRALNPAAILEARARAEATP